jgi:hypothetical protein
VMYSTMEYGTVASPASPRVLLVGNHMIMGIELISLAAEFLRHRASSYAASHTRCCSPTRRGRGHGATTSSTSSTCGVASRSVTSPSTICWPPASSCFCTLAATGRRSTATFGSILISRGRQIFSLISSCLESFRMQGESHKLFWPAQTEFVRMAAQFNAIIVPFGVVGEDDLLQVRNNFLLFNLQPIKCFLFIPHLVHLLFCSCDLD